MLWIHNQLAALPPVLLILFPHDKSLSEITGKSSRCNVPDQVTCRLISGLEREDTCWRVYLIDCQLKGGKVKNRS